MKGRPLPRTDLAHVRCRWCQQMTERIETDTAKAQQSCTAVSCRQKQAAYKAELAGETRAPGRAA